VFPLLQSYKTGEIEKLPIPRCRKCGSALDAEYDYNSIKKLILRDDFMRDKPAHWKYWAFMPVKDLSKMITMARRKRQCLRTAGSGMMALLIKYEASNPTVLSRIGDHPLNNKGLNLANAR